MKNIMKTFLLSLILILVSTVSASALELAWDHVDSAVPGVITGYVLYYAATDGSLGPFNRTILGGANTSVVIPTIEFKPNVEYTFTVTAFNDFESDHSVPLMWTRHGWGPPVDNVSSEEYVKPGKPNNLREK